MATKKSNEKKIKKTNANRKTSNKKNEVKNKNEKNKQNSVTKKTLDNIDIVKEKKTSNKKTTPIKKEDTKKTANNTKKVEKTNKTISNSKRKVTKNTLEKEEKVTTSKTRSNTKTSTKTTINKKKAETKKTTIKTNTNKSNTKDLKNNKAKPNYAIENYIDKVLEQKDNIKKENTFKEKDYNNNDLDKKNDTITIDGIDYEVEYKKIKVRKLKKKNLVLLIILLIFVIIFIFTVFKIFFWVSDNHKSNNQIKDIIEHVQVEEVKEEDNVEIIENSVEKNDPYWDYIKMNLIDVDIRELKQQNNDTKGWIQVKGTNINYPFVQTVDNDYYLTHSFDKTYNEAGWIFLDYRNNLFNEEKNTIIYGHSRINKTMFGSLKNILTSDWLNNSDNYIIKLSTEYENTLWQIFSIYRIPTTVDYLKTKFNSDEQFGEFANMLLKRSAHNFNTTVLPTDRILTLSTCYDNSDKVVLHAKLIKRDSKS